MRDYLLSLPERVLRSATALAAGLLNQVGEAALPGWLRRTRLYRNLVEATLRFLVEKVGEVEGVFPAEGQLAEDFLLRRAAGNGIELVGILTFHASPVWLLAALADLSGAGRTLISEIAASLREAGLIAPDSHPASVDQVLDALESASARAAESINTPPLDVAGLRAEWSDFRRSFERLPAASLPGIDKLEETWRQIRETARAEKRGVFELSALLALEDAWQPAARLHLAGPQCRRGWTGALAPCCRQPCWTTTPRPWPPSAKRGCRPGGCASSGRIWPRRHTSFRGISRH